MSRRGGMTSARATSNCDCGGPCFYCGRVLLKYRHEHDHFPVPWRHGGRETVPACLECHDLKDRLWAWDDEQFITAAEKGLSRKVWFLFSILYLPDQLTVPIPPLRVKATA